MKLGFALAMPELNSINQIKDKDLELKLVKGPGEDFDNILLFSEQASFGGLNDNVFDFVLRAQVSTSSTPPKIKPTVRDVNQMAPGVRPGNQLN